MPIPQLLVPKEDEKEDGWVKSNAAWALGEIGDRTAIGVLLKAAKTQLKTGNDAELRMLVEALDKLGFLDSYGNRK